MPNHLIHENSPYLLQHAGNPVNWYPWGKIALEKARLEDKPIFLSVGYAACHWCHVMEHESFEDNETAELMNEHFVNIKVDREERPDIDSIYMQAVVAMNKQGGWPMSVFLTPEGKPFYAGTYFPPVRRYNMPSFKEILLTVSRFWKDDREKLVESGEQISQHLQRQNDLSESHGIIDDEKLDEAYMILEKSYDWENGGWGRAPKFPQPMVIEYLMRRGMRDNKAAIEMATHALHAMAKGGMYDVVGGGFARYSVDDIWQIPHFEKMLYDNAQLAIIYLHAYLITGERNFKQVCEETLDFVVREMTHTQGGFFSSLDADSEGEEGKFYVWTPKEIQDIIKNPGDVALILAAYGVTKSGNFEGANILHRIMDDEQIAKEFNLAFEDIPTKLAELHTLLLDARTQRIRPETDDKILVFWNALMLTAFAEAGRYLKRKDYTQVAIRNAMFLKDNLCKEDRLLRSWREGIAKYNAYLEDYSGMILGLLAIYQTDSNPRWYQFALKLAEEMVDHFSDLNGGFFDTRDDHEALLYRPKDLQDNATPSGNAMAALALLQLSSYGDRVEYRDIAENMLISNQEAMASYPTSFAQWLSAADFALGDTYEVVISGDIKQPETQFLIDTLWHTYRPHLVSAISDHPPEAGSPALLENRILHKGLPTAYVCQGFVCQRPVNSPEELAVQIKN